jgi:ribosomal protein S18 acetylase RimI-like enzyme
MAIHLDEEPPEPVVPDGLRLEPFDRADERAVHEAIQEAFVDHWEHVPSDYEAWARRRADSDRSLWFVVKDGAEIAGVCVNDRKRYGAGWIGTVATRRPWRGRGVAQALLLTSFREFRQRGERVVALGVDATNPTGAVAVYERVGMHTVWRADVYEKMLA